VSKKVGKAVTRNLIKRRIRAAIRNLTQQYKGYDVVVVARKPIVTHTYNDILHALQKALENFHKDEKTGNTLNKSIQACTVTCSAQ
jgi:ribonuclease P protein component